MAQRTLEGQCVMVKAILGRAQSCHNAPNGPQVDTVVTRYVWRVSTRAGAFARARTDPYAGFENGSISSAPSFTEWFTRGLTR